LVFGPVSGAHFNPVVSAVDWWLGRRQSAGLAASEALAYGTTQILGAIAGAILANVMFDLPAIQVSGTDRISLGHGVGEVVATAGLVLVIFALARTGRAALSAAAVGAYIGAAYWFTSSTSFANPAVTVGRVFSDTFAGIAPSSALFFLGTQLLGAAVGLGLVITLFPDVPAAATGRAIVPHPSTRSEKS
jgi:glycerol uptake facilitator-like aquaporin